MAIHQIDLFHALFGPARRLHYSGGHYGAAARDFDDVATILLEFQSSSTSSPVRRAPSPCRAYRPFPPPKCGSSSPAASHAWTAPGATWSTDRMPTA
jgi:hypothetical protein